MTGVQTCALPIYSTENKYTQQVLNRAFAGGFSMALMVKDLKTALEVAQSSGMPTPLADVTVDVWAKAQALLGGAVDHTALAQYVEHLAGSEIGAGPKG